MIAKPGLENRKEQAYAAIRTAVPIPFGQYLQPLWDEVRGWLKHQGSPGPAIIRYFSTDMSRKFDIDVGFVKVRVGIGKSVLKTEVGRLRTPGARHSSFRANSFINTWW